MSRDLTREGRKANGASADGGPDPSASDAAVKAVGRQSQKKAGPDGPSAAEVGDTFKSRR